MARFISAIASSVTTIRAQICPGVAIVCDREIWIEFDRAFEFAFRLWPSPSHRSRQSFGDGVGLREVRVDFECFGHSALASGLAS